MAARTHRCPSGFLLGMAGIWPGGNVWLIQRRRRWDYRLVRRWSPRFTISAAFYAISPTSRLPALLPAPHESGAPPGPETVDR